MKACLSINKQRGSSLVEAIVALILLAIVSKGAVYLAGRATAAQGETQLQEIALSAMREAVANNSLKEICTTPASPPQISLPNGITLDTVPQGCGDVITATITASTQTYPSGTYDIPAPVVLATNHPVIGGELVVGGTWSGDLPEDPTVVKNQ